MDERKIARARAEALLARYNDQTSTSILAANLPPSVIEAKAWSEGCSVTPIPRYPPDRAVMMIHPDDPLRSSVWAVKGVGSHISVFKHFLTVAHGLAKPMIPPEYHVDHLRAKSTADATALIRLEMVAKEVNTSHGAGAEKQKSKSAVTKGRMARRNTPGSLPWDAALKLAGVLSPVLATSKDHAMRRAEAVAWFTARGWDRETVESGLAALEELAARR